MSENYSTFGSYILFKEVLRDDLGRLWRAAELDRKGIARTVWLRVFDRPYIPSADLIARLEVATQIGRELEAGTLVSRPKVLVEGGTVAVAWDWVSAQPLNKTLQRVTDEGFPVPVDNALLILEKIALALTAALAFEIRGEALVHGFVHPGLVLVGTDGEAQLAAFGLADQLLGVLDDPGNRDRFAPYLAPEVLASRTPSKRADVYSLGAILFHLLTGHALPADPGARAQALADAELAYDDQPVPADIRALLERALGARPEDRFSSAADFKKELDKLLYGGAYSPTTFNLALFMDRLFRAEVETEERERSAESQVDPASYLRPEPKIEPTELTTAPEKTGGPGKGLWIGIAAAAAVVIVGLGLLLMREPSGPPPTPTPGPEELRARREAQQRQMQQLVQEQLEAMLAEREQQIREELLARQGKIDELQRRLQDMEKKSRSGGSDAKEAQRTRAEIERQLAAEEAAKREQEAALEAERQKALEAAQQQVAAAASEDQVEPDTKEPPARATSSASGPGAATVPTSAPAADVPATPRPSPTLVRVAEKSAPTASSGGAVTENQYVPAPDCDSLPTVLKDQAVVWPRLAVMSRRRGVVILQATVNASGRVDDVKVLRADHEGFGIPQAAMEAVRGYVFKPATKNGVRVKSTATVTVPYAFARN